MKASEELEVDRQKNCMDKLTWPSRELASAAAMYATWQHGDSITKSRPYECNYCSRWHLTS